MIKKLWSYWEQFWFDGPVGLLNLAVFRIIFSGTLFVMYLSRQTDVDLFYTDQGILPKALSVQILPEGFRPPWQLTFWPDAWVGTVHLFFVLCLLMVFLGFFSRIFAWIAVYLHVSFLYRNYGVAFGVDQITSFFLVYLAFTQSDARLSVRSWWRQKKGKLPLGGDTLTTVFYRLIQLQLCVIYAYSGMEKLRGASWWDGTALWSVFANSQFVIADLTWMRHLPFLIVAISFSTILFEIYFPVLVWGKKSRPYVLAAGVLFHSGIAIVMALWSFAVVMLSPYVLFLSEEKLKIWLQTLQKKIFPSSR